jgi:hypothetical protein
MKWILTTAVLLVLVSARTVFAQEIYHWVDENGVSHYSQTAPAGAVDGVETMSLEDTAPADNDPGEDIYGVEAQAERMAALRQEMEEKRDTRRESRAANAQQPVVQYQNPVNYGYGPFWRPPFRPLPPVEPEPPIAEPYPISTLRPPGGTPQGER